MPEPAPLPLRILLVGHGRMGRLIESLAPEYGCEVTAILFDENNLNASGLTDEVCARADVAVDFSVGEAVPENLARLAEAGVSAVVGTTGWGGHADRLRGLVDTSGIGVVVAPNCSPGAVLFEVVVERAASLLGAVPDYGAFIHEVHHDKKKDAPSGTALGLKAAMERAGYGRTVDMASTRVGHVPGIHTVGFDGPSDSLTFTHTVRDRGTFARGALLAARWVHGRRGWFTMRDVLLGGG